MTGVGEMALHSTDHVKPHTSTVRLWQRAAVLESITSPHSALLKTYIFKDI